MGEGSALEDNELAAIGCSLQTSPGACLENHSGQQVQNKRVRK